MLVEFGISFVPHYTPLHYLPFIARSQAIKSKPALRADGFEEIHFRSKSAHHDETRGFGEFAFLTLDTGPRIVKAKLYGGFPHIEISVPAAAIDDVEFALCRYNIAMTRVLKRNDLPGRPESDTNGRYYDDNQIPIAKTEDDKLALLNKHYGTNMIEVLILGQLPLPNEVKVICYDDDDAAIAEKILGAVESEWCVEKLDAPGPYNRKSKYVSEVKDFIDQALADPDWRGNGLEFDKV